jgi:hypothetical protein
MSIQAPAPPAPGLLCFTVNLLFLFEFNQRIALAGPNSGRSGRPSISLTWLPGPSTAGFENLMRGPPKENTGNENIRVKDNFHLKPRTLATAASTSDFLNPALRA